MAAKQRRSIRNDVAGALRRLCELCVANQDYEGALSAASQLLALEPLDEATHRQLMQLHARRGSITEALRQFRVCRDALRRELDVAPEPATEALYRDLMRRRRATLEPGIVSQGALSHADDSPAESVPQASADRANRAPGLRDAIVMVIRFDGLPEIGSGRRSRRNPSVVERTANARCQVSTGIRWCRRSPARCQYRRDVRPACSLRQRSNARRASSADAARAACH